MLAVSAIAQVFAVPIPGNPGDRFGGRAVPTLAMAAFSLDDPQVGLADDAGALGNAGRANLAVRPPRDCPASRCPPACTSTISPVTDRIAGSSDATKGATAHPIASLPVAGSPPEIFEDRVWHSSSPSPSHRGMTTAADLMHADFATLPDLIRANARATPDKTAIADDATSITYAELDRAMDRVAAALQRDGTVQHQAVAIVAHPSVEQAIVFLGTLRAGSIAAPVQPSATPGQIAAMLADSGADLVFLDAANAAALTDVPLVPRTVMLADLAAWVAPEGITPAPVTIAPADGFNIIYSSGTTGTPKGIVQSHAMRFQHLSRNTAANFGSAVTMIATPLCSNTTLVSFLPTLGWGGTVVLMRKFDARRYLELAERHRATHTMLVPVQYQRIMALPDFDTFDLSSFVFKTSTSAPFSAALKREVVARWPGVLVEYYGMTEGGASFALNATAHPDKLHTVGLPMPGHDARLIDDDGRDVAPGEAGEIVGRSGAMMTGYHGRADATDAAHWHDADGNRYIRHGDIGRFDGDGFLILMDRKKDLIISGGYNIYPSDLESVLAGHPDVADCTVVGMPSAAWGETPVGFYVPVANATQTDAAILAATNARLGRTQRLAALHAVTDLPRSAIGKVLKRELRDRLATQTGDMA